MTFQLDTSGIVRLDAPHTRSDGKWAQNIDWSDLPAFTQGYVEALLRGAENAGLCVSRYAGMTALRRAKFTDLAPETLARIMADCERWQDGKDKSERTPKQRGAAMWAACSNAGLTPYLGDDGRVYLKDAA